MLLSEKCKCGFHFYSSEVSALSFFKILRVLTLLCILAFAAFYTKAQRLGSRAWLEPLEIVIFPIGVDQSPSVDEYIATLNDDVFTEIDRFMKSEGEAYEVNSDPPTRTILGPKVDVLPPSSPSPAANVLEIIWWSMKLRLWAYRHTPKEYAGRDSVNMYVLYHELEAGRRLKHSFGLDKGLIGVVHAFASSTQQAQNNIVITHELLHTVGAKDKYGIDGEPFFTEGYAEPGKDPLFPQQFAEIMAGKIPISEKRSQMADSLRSCVIGETTAMEINWLQSN